MATTFPSHFINPIHKGKSWILKYAKAIDANRSVMPNGYFVNGANKFDERETYALGKQSIEKYKKFSSPDKIRDQRDLSLDFSVIPIIPKYINITVAKILQRIFDPVAQAIDPLAKSEQDDEYNALYAKVLMRKSIEEAGGNVADYPFLAKLPSEPEDIRQLEIIKEYGYKHKLASEAELIISESFERSKLERERKLVVKDLINHGLGGYRDYLGDDGKSTFRRVAGKRFGVSYCEKEDFSDASYMYEEMWVPLSAVSKHFTKNQLLDICSKVQNQYGNFSYNERAYETMLDRYKIRVLDIQFLSYNSKVFKEDKYNPDSFSEADYSDLEKVKPDNYENEKEQYEAIDLEVLYQCKYIVGTDYLYDWGLKPNQKRKDGNWLKVKFDFHMYAWNFYDMQYSGITEWLLPLADEYQQTILKIQNVKNKLIPYAITVNVNALRNVNFGQGGVPLQPKAILEMLFENYVLLYNDKDLITGEGTPSKPISVEATGMAGELVYLSNELQRIEDGIRRVTGLNEVTDGSAPDPKMLTTGLNLANTSTNNALFLISEADKMTILSLADGIVENTRMAIQRGDNIEGFVRVFGRDTVDIFKVSKDFSLHDYGVFLEESPSIEQRQMLLQQFNNARTQNFITASDVLFLQSIRNYKLAASLLDDKVQRRIEEQHQRDLAKIKAQTDGNERAAALSAQNSERLEMLQHTNKKELANINGQWTFITKELGTEASVNSAKIISESREAAARISKNKNDTIDIASLLAQ